MSDVEISNSVKLQQWLAATAASPWATDFYVAMRRVESAHPNLPRFGSAKSPKQEAIRLGQEPALTFAPANLYSVDVSRECPKLTIRFLGLFGPMGALPTHLSEVALDRRRVGDATIVEFADVFHHRLIAFFYRAWRQSQPAASRDHPVDDAFAGYVNSLVGIAQPSMLGKDQIQDDAKRYFSGHLSRVVRSEAGFIAATQEYFSVPIKLVNFHPRWVRLATEELSVIGGEYSQLGKNTVLGARVFDAQSNIQLVIGPLSKERYQSFLPGGRSMIRLKDWVRTFFGLTIAARVQLVLKADEVPLCRLGQGPQLGWTTWIGPGAASRDRNDLELGEQYV
jgi:type VI secretion system protein ImpH